MPRLKDLYYKKIVPNVMKQYNLKNINEVPILEKIVVNVGVGEAKDNPKLLTAAAEELTAITGQKAVITKAKKSISNFKLRKGVPIGAKVTLRGNRMWEFFDRLVNVALPRVRDFKGLGLESFDRFNNYSIGIKEQIIFPEINYDKVEKFHGLDIILVIKSKQKNDIVKGVLEGIGMPFRKIEIQEPPAQRPQESKSPVELEDATPEVAASKDETPEGATSKVETSKDATSKDTKSKDKTKSLNSSNMGTKEI